MIIYTVILTCRYLASTAPSKSHDVPTETISQCFRRLHSNFSDFKIERNDVRWRKFILILPNLYLGIDTKRRIVRLCAVPCIVHSVPMLGLFGNMHLPNEVSNNA